MKTFNDLVAENFKIPAVDIADTMTSQDIPEWDSMNYLLFIADLEKEYEMSFTMDDLMNMVTFADIKKAIRAKGRDI